MPEPRDTRIAALPKRADVVIVGGGHAGLAMSSFLSQAGREHLVLDRSDRLGGGWQDRWDEFRLVTPNWTSSFPGWAYDGPDPDGFMSRDEIQPRPADCAPGRRRDRQLPLASHPAPGGADSWPRHATPRARVPGRGGAA
jgi:putative flavoprotein involved in K+ transport